MWERWGSPDLADMPGRPAALAAAMTSWLIHGARAVLEAELGSFGTFDDPLCAPHPDVTWVLGDGTRGPGLGDLYLDRLEEPAFSEQHGHLYGCAVAGLLERHGHASMSTAAHVLASAEEYRNPNIVKVVCDANGFALYFSRSPIPMARDQGDGAWWQDAARDTLLLQAAPMRHIGIYGYRAGFLRLFPRLAPAPLERAEALEQLRALWHGHRIAVHVTDRDPGPGIDTPQDLERVRRIFRGE